MDSINNKINTFVSGAILTLVVLISTLTQAFEYDQLRLVLVVFGFASFAGLVTSIVRWYKYGIVTVFKKPEDETY